MGKKKYDKKTNLCFPKLSIGCIFYAIKVHGTNTVSIMVFYIKFCTGTFK